MTKRNLVLMFGLKAKHSATKKPNFKVKHPYGYLIKSMVAGLVMFFVGVVSLGTGFFGINKLDGNLKGATYYVSTAAELSSA